MAVVILLVVGVSALHAVTREEMEQARTIAAKSYLRWANDGSGYLDELNPKTMAQLEQSLKAKEKENIAAFKAVKTPTDYSSWDKEALVKYWSETFFASPGLSDKGKAARNVVKRKVSAMNVSSPAAATPDKKEENAPAADKTVAQGQEVENPATADKPAGDVGNAENIEAVSDEMAGIIAEAAELDSTEAVVEQADTKKDSGSSVWIYILALVVLVGVVVWLVIFASKTMKNAEEFSEVKDKERSLQPEEPEDRGLSAATSSADAAIIESERVRELVERESKLKREVMRLREENLRLVEECERLKIDLATAQRTIAEQPVEVVSAAHTAPAAASAVTEAETENISEQPRRRRSAATREIFLGRVNAKGLFVRADRNLTPGKSVYRLTTTDGFTGTYRVVTDEEMVDTMLDNPVEYLSGGCVAKDLEDTDGMMEIITESAGTAIFEDGCWRVLRKAKISYK